MTNSPTGPDNSGSPVDDSPRTGNAPGDSYTGKVTVGGPAAVRTLNGLTIAKLAVGPMSNNAYLLTCHATAEMCLIDAAADAADLMRLLDGDPLEQIITTHRHPDHWAALAEVARATGARTYAGRADVEGIDVGVSEALDEGDVVAVGAAELQVISLVGHTPGSIALRYDDPDGLTHLFTGDSLFPRGPGKTHSPEDFASLMTDLQTKVFDVLPDETWFYPGHGDDSTLGAERASLPDWLARGW